MRNPLIIIAGLVALTGHAATPDAERKLQLREAHMLLERNNPDLAEELGLTKDQASKLLDLLVEHRVANDNVAFGKAIAGGSAVLEQYLLRSAIRTSGQRLEIAALLGSATYPRWLEYEQNLAARNRFDLIRSILIQASQPLSEQQRKPLVASLIKSDRVSRAAGPQATSSPGDRPDRKTIMTAAIKGDIDNRRRMLGAASPHLTPAQTDALRAEFSKQDLSAQQRLAELGVR